MRRHKCVASGRAKAAPLRPDDAGFLDLDKDEPLAATRDQVDFAALPPPAAIDYRHSALLVVPGDDIFGRKAAVKGHCTAHLPDTMPRAA